MTLLPIAVAALGRQESHGGQSAWNAQFIIEMDEMTDIWGLANGFSHQIVQIYVDQGDTTYGEVEMLTGANAEVIRIGLGKLLSVALASLEQSKQCKRDCVAFCSWYRRKWQCRGQDDNLHSK